MKLRIARKMDQGTHAQQRARGDKRTWWFVYTDGQLKRAERRLLRSWLTHRPLQADGCRRVHRELAANRVNSRRVRQRIIRRLISREHRSHER